MKSICKNCSHWKLDKYDVADEIISPIDFDTYDPIKVPFELRYCKSPKLRSSARPEEKSGFSASARFYGDAKLATGPEFGCIHFEVKP